MGQGCCRTLEAPAVEVVEAEAPQDDPASGSEAGSPSGAAGAGLESEPEETGDSPEPAPQGRSAGRITEQMLGPPCDDFADAMPSWSWEDQTGKWKAYTLQESILLDRYWQVYAAAREERSPLCTAEVRLRRRAFIDFSDMTCRIGGARPRSIRREVTDPGWLNNSYFFAAFRGALTDAGADVRDTPRELFNFHYNQDFRDLKDNGKKLRRGGQQYELPIGWKRFAVNVQGQYDGGSDDWLKEDDSGWAVAYHGTNPEGLPGILCAGFRVGDRQKFEKVVGKGVYCTPRIDVAQHFSKPRSLLGHEVQVVLQLRVKPSQIHKITDSRATSFERKYWVINSPEHIRAYGVLVREFPLSKYVPPEVMVFGKGHGRTKQVLKDIQLEIAASKDAVRRGGVVKMA